MKYYFDTCIWIDFFENREDRFRPLGEWALRLINKIIQENNTLLYSKLINKELNKFYTEELIKERFLIFPAEILKKVAIIDEQIKESRILSKKLKIPRDDVLHAIIARDNNAIMITRDKHFYELSNITIIKKPEDLI